MTLSELEAHFATAVTERFAFLCDDFGCAAFPPTEDGRGVRLVHHMPRLEVRNYLEGDERYETGFLLLSAGRPIQLLDPEGDERFASFDLGDAVGPQAAQAPELADGAVADIPSLDKTIGARAAAVRQLIPTLLADDGEVDNIRSRIKLDRLRFLIPSWREFVSDVASGTVESGMRYVAGVNTRGAIKSLLKWAGQVPNELLSELQRVDSEFDRMTTPLPYARGPGVFPHPRAKRWWRTPKSPQIVLGGDTPSELTSRTRPG